MSTRLTPDDDLHRALAAGGDITLAPGTYSGSFELSASVTLRGEPGAVLDAQGRGPVLLCQDDALELSLSDLTLRGGHSELGAAVCLVAQSNLTLRRCTLVDNRAVQLAAGGAGAAAGHLVLEHCTLDESSSVWLLEQAQAELLNCRVAGQVGVVDGAQLTAEGGAIERLLLRANPRHTPTARLSGVAVASVHNDAALPGHLIAQ